MSPRLNRLGQPIGEALPDWKPSRPPAQKTLRGRYSRLEALDPDAHAATLFEACAKDEDGAMWTYMPTGPFASEAVMRAWMEGAAQSPDPLFYAIVNPWENRATGHATYLRIQPQFGVIEVGFIAYSPELQRTPAATEAMYLMMRHAFDDLGYRRYE